jgi:hypothetical protein
MYPTEAAWQKAERDVTSWMSSVTGKRFLIGYDMYLDHCVNYIIAHRNDGWERHVLISESITDAVDVNMYELIGSYVFNGLWQGITD